MIVFNTDLDNTLIYSYKRDIGPARRNVELYQGREISFITEKTYELLCEAKEKVLLVPTTTRTTAQYERIDLGIGIPEYALTCNGGILLINGVENQEWYEESLRLIAECRDVLEKAVRLLEDEKRRTFEVRFIRELFVFTKCDEPEAVVRFLCENLDREKADIFHNGTKVYVVPKPLSKGCAVRRFREYVNAEYVISAGDSEFDIPMLEEADLGIAPGELSGRCRSDREIVYMGDNKIYSEMLLEHLLDFCKEFERIKSKRQ